MSACGSGTPTPDPMDPGSGGTLALGGSPQSAGGTSAGGATSAGGRPGSAGSISVEPQAGTGAGAGCATTLSGVVTTPAGTLPLYNVMVYVPSVALEPLPEGASCDRCEGVISAEPVASALTDTHGQFVMDVPPGENVPVVIQVGKWRRELTVPRVTACSSSVLDADLTRLPRDRSEGHLPKIALSTGGLDALECLLRKLGIADSEFTTASDDGRVHLFAGGSGTREFSAGVDFGALFPLPEISLWGADGDLAAYDVVLLACEGSEYPITKPVAARQAMFDYANAGGRVLFSHYHKFWLEAGPAPFPEIMSFNDSIEDLDLRASVDTSFPKGAALAEWLVNVGGSDSPGFIELRDAQNTGGAENPELAQRWIYDPMDATSLQPSAKYVTANTPLGSAPDAQCGRIVYSDIHVSTDDPNGDQSAPAYPFPRGCRTSALTPQEKALIFMFFDLSACVLDDHVQPMPPVVVR